MKNVKVVIGSNYGDEGKGLFTDYLAYQSQGTCLVVRYNGGCQAGHTVVTPDSKRHVFSHVGSGTFCDCPTYLSSYFIVNPFMFNDELRHLNQKNSFPTIFVDKSAAVSTPYDVFVNQIVEEFRGKNKHGSCGLGIYQTVVRDGVIPLRVQDLLSPKSAMVSKMNEIREYFRKVLYSLGIKLSDKDEYLFFSDSIIDKYLKDVEQFLSNVVLTSESRLGDYETVIFEGAQGLLLDEKYGKFPHLTPSSTGLENPIQMIKKNYYEFVDVYYITRGYVTRHGAGPLLDESTPRDLCLTIKDETNVYNVHQGDLRYAPLNIDRLREVTEADYLHSIPLRNSTINYGITCLDHIQEHPDDVVSSFKSSLEVDSLYLSYGPTRDTLVEV